MDEVLSTGIAREETPVYYTYKDRVFRMLFREKKRLLELYNALNDTAYTNEDDLIVNTLENAIFIKMKNDVSFIIDSNMCLYEHQASYCPNMPLRGFLYFADLYKKHVRNVELSSNRRIMIPAPYYIVFSNGCEKKEEVIAMSIYEYNEEYVKKALYEDGMEAGYDKGKIDGVGEMLVKNVDAVIKNLQTDTKRACEILGTTVEKYEEAKNKLGK